MKKILAVVFALLTIGARAQAQGAVDAESVYLGTYGGTIVRFSSGTGAPSGGTTGDFYIDYGSGEVYAKRSSGTWTLLVRAEDTNTFIVTQTFAPPNASIGIVIQGGTAPTNNMFRVVDTGAVIRARIDQNYDFILRSSGGVDKISLFSNTGNATFAGTLGVTGDVAVNTNKFNVTAASGNTTVAGTLGVTGDVAVNTNKFNVTASSGNTTIAGTLGVTGDVAVNTNKFTVTAASGNTVVAGTLGVTGTETVSANILPAVNYTSDLGAPTAKFKQINGAELLVETLVAQQTVATIGGRIVVAPTNLLSANLAAAATTITVKYNNLVNGDRIYLEANGAVEWMAVTSGAGGSAGVYTYTVTRNLDGSGADNWNAGDAIVDTGTTGNGYLDIFSTTGVLSGTGPTIIGNVRTGTTYNNIANRWAIGNLKSLYGYAASDLYGACFGDASAANLCIDATNGIRIRNGTTNKIVLDASGNASFSQGNTTIDSNGIRLTPTTAATFAYNSTYGFNMTTSNTGMWAVQTAGGVNALVFDNQWTGAGSVSQSNIVLEWGNGAYNGSLAMYAANALGKSQVVLTAGEIQLVGPITLPTGSDITQSNGGATLVNTFQPGFIGTSTGDVQFLAGNATKIKCFSGGGCTMGSPTGGDKGAGTLNVATGLYLNGTAFTNPEPALLALEARIAAVEEALALIQKGGRQ